MQWSMRWDMIFLALFRSNNMAWHWRQSRQMLRRCRIRYPVLALLTIALALLATVAPASSRIAPTRVEGGVSVAVERSQFILEKLAQQQEATPSQSDRAAAERIFQEGEQLRNQGTKESLRQAIQKYEEALRLWKVLGDRKREGDREREAATFNILGDIYAKLGEKQKALDYFTQALALHRILGQKNWEAITLSQMGEIYTELGEKQSALDYFTQALPLYRSTEERGWEISTLSSIANIYSGLGQTQKALVYYDQILSLHRSMGNRTQEAATLHKIGSIYFYLDEKQKALNYFSQALPLLQALDERQGEANTLNYIGLVYSNLGETQKALDFFLQALPIVRTLGIREGEASILTSIGATYNELGKKQQAENYLNEALSIRRTLKDPGGEAATLNNLGRLYSSLDYTQKTLEYYTQALLLRRAARDRAGEAVILNSIGGVYLVLGENQKALDNYTQALSIWEELNNQSEKANTLNSIGVLYSSWSEKQKALNYYNQALSLYQKLGKYEKVAAVLNNLGVLYDDLGEDQKALDYLNQALPIVKKIGDIKGQITILQGIGVKYSTLDQYQKALDYFTQALNLAKSISSKREEAFSLIYMGTLLGMDSPDIGQKQRGLDALNQALPITRAIGDRNAEGRVLNSLGNVYYILGDKEKALKYFTQSLSIRRAIEDRNEEAVTLTNIVAVKQFQGNFKEALADIEAAAKIVESLRTKIINSDLRASYFATSQNIYRRYVDILMAMHRQNPNAGHDIAAFEISEHARARSLIELLNEGRADIRQGLDPELGKKQRQLLQQLNARTQYQLELFKSQFTEEQKQAIRKEIAEIQTQLQEVENQIRVKNPRYAELTQPQPLTLKEIQQQVVDDNTILLAYWLGEERSYLWAITSTTVNTYVLPKRAEIETAATQFSNFLIDPAETRDKPTKAAAATAALSQMLLGPVAGQLGQKRLVIVSDGMLQYIPFSALSAPQASSNDEVKLLLVEHEIVNLPSASTLALIRRIAQRQPAPKALAVLADPVFSQDDSRVKGNLQVAAPTSSELRQMTRGLNDGSAVTLFGRLPGTEQEANKILALVPQSDRFGAFDFAASRETATSPQLSQYRVLHFATHGFFNTVHPELSGIVLSLVNQQGQPQNGLLMTPDIFNLNLPAELIVLSGCQTGLGKEIKGEGLVGLTRGLMYAGASRVIVSLWSVNDQSTAELMSRFYQKMLQEKMSPAAALRAAQISMWKEKREPYSWAAFILQGEWK